MSVGVVGVEVVYSCGDGVGVLMSRFVILYIVVIGLIVVSRILDCFVGGIGEGL